MSERIAAQSLRHPDRITGVEYLYAEPLGAGGVEDKRLVQAKLGDRALTFIEREHSEVYEQNWLAMRNAGLPVVSTLRTYQRMTAEGPQKSLLLGDVKADGSELYGRGMRTIIRKRLPREHANPAIDPLFVELTGPDNFARVTEQAMDYSTKAFEHGIRLACDDPFEMVVRPDGSWNLLMLDLRLAKCFGPETNKVALMVDADNDNFTKMFLDNLQEIRYFLSTGQQDPRTMGYVPEVSVT